MEPGDYLLDWRSGGRGLRYVHHFDEAELEALADASRFRICSAFLSDGENGQLGLVPGLGGSMKTKEEIVKNWLPRYTGMPLEEFGKYILLVNFSNYVHMFAEMNGTRVCCEDKPMPNATADGITIINFGMGSANAATVMDLLSAIKPKAVLFLGKCGGLKKSKQPGGFDPSDRRHPR